MYKTLKISILLILVVVGHPKSIIEIVKYFHTNNCIDIEKEDEERHKA
jgi:hypothetical protein